MDRAPDEVFNQSGELSGYGLFSTHSAREALRTRSFAPQA
jgi:hypothetical protein